MVCTVKNRQVQGIRAGTTIIVDVCISVGVGHGVGLTSAFRPGEAFANGGIKHVVCTVKDGQVQSIHTGTSIGIGVCMSVSVGHGVSLASAFRPGISFTNDSIENIVSTLEDCQMHDDRTVTTCSICEDMGIITALRDTLIFIPVKSVTCSFYHMRSIDMQRKSQRHHIIRRVALGLQIVILCDAGTSAVHRNHKSVKGLCSAQRTNGHSDFAIHTTVH